MCTGKIVKNILGKDVSKDREKTEYGEGWGKSEWKETKEGTKYLSVRRLKKKTPQSVIDDINKRFK